MGLMVKERGENKDIIILQGKRKIEEKASYENK